MKSLQLNHHERGEQDNRKKKTPFIVAITIQYKGSIERGKNRGKFPTHDSKKSALYLSILSALEDLISPLRFQMHRSCSF